MEQPSTPALLPDHLVNVALGAFKSQMFATAIDIGLFDYLQREWKHIDQICKDLDINCRIPSDFFNILHSEGVVER